MGIQISQADEVRLKAALQYRESKGYGGGLVDDLEFRVGDAGLDVKKTLLAVGQITADYKKAAATAGDQIPDWLLASIIRAFVGRGEIAKLPLLQGDFQGEEGVAQRISNQIDSPSFTDADMILARLSIAQEVIR